MSIDQPAISIDLGGSHATIAVVQGTKLLASREVELDHAQDLRPVLDVFAAAIIDLLRELKLKAEQCQGIALGFCGLADARTGRVTSTNKKYEDAPGIDFRAWSRQSFGLPFAIENDARMALLGERYAGAARGYDDVVMITLGTGIGGAAMIEASCCAGNTRRLAVSADICRRSRWPSVYVRRDWMSRSRSFGMGAAADRERLERD